jgi:hypothetical protein
MGITDIKIGNQIRDSVLSFVMHDPSYKNIIVVERVKIMLNFFLITYQIFFDHTTEDIIDTPS